MSNTAEDKTDKITASGNDGTREDIGISTDRIEVGNVLAEMEKALNDIVSDNPRISNESESGNVHLEDLKAVLEISLAINSSFILEDMLQVVMEKAVELLSAERGFIMLLDNSDNLQFKSAHNIQKEETREEHFKISFSIANRVAQTGKAVYTSDAQEDERYSSQKSVVELHLRSIMCVPLKIKNQVIGIIYLDNSSQAKLFLKSDLFLFELFAQQAAIAIHNAQLYNRLSRLKQYNEDIIQQSPVCIIVLDSNYNLVTINEASLKTFQVNKGQVNSLGMSETKSSFIDLIPDAEYVRWKKMIEPVLAGLGDFEDDRYFHNTGYEEKVLSIKISQTNSLPDQNIGVILVIEDITEKVILEKYVILSEKLVAKGEMAASIGHELNNFLTIISNNAELMQVNIDREKYDKVVHNSHQVVENVQKIKRFTDGLMDFSKLETEMVEYSIRHLMENLLFTIKPQRKFSDVELELSCVPELPDMLLDVGQIQQVLLNFLNNAVDAMKDVEEPKIKMQCGLTDDKEFIQISVCDNGSGISEENRDNIFEARFTTKDDGHGLGLSNSRKIIRNHGGDIKVESDVGKGTTFYILLPCKRQPKK
ncbi:MAG: GAF domain-containing protein [candidate division Zixibacteria bacterium]|nr:GAF domain-containing protein [candidate division Zixibacteria bacterium]